MQVIVYTYMQPESRRTEPQNRVPLPTTARGTRHLAKLAASREQTSDSDLYDWRRVVDELVEGQSLPSSQARRPLHLGERGALPPTLSH